MVEWFSAPDYWTARWLLQRGLGGLYLVAFLVAVNQFRPLLGERGLLPAPDFLAVVPFRRAPSLFHWRYSDRLLGLVAWTGTALSAVALSGLSDAGSVWQSMLVWLTLWVLYLSIVNIGQTFYAFGWESLLLEAGFLAIFLGPSALAPPLVGILLVRWLLFRLEFGAGLIKLRGDPCWRKLTCLDYHHATQPMPNPFSWFFHRLPRPLHRVEVLVNHAAQLVMPFALFLPQPAASAAGVVIVVTQGWLVASGNFAWLNVATIVLALAAFDDGALGWLPVSAPDDLQNGPPWFVAAVIAVTLLVAVLSYWPVRNLLGRRQLMNASFNSLHLVNTYGAFGTVTKDRPEIVIEGTDAAEPSTAVWKPYEFKGKPGDPTRRPPQVAPYHLRLDWLMWFAAMSSPVRHRWFPVLLVRLLEGDEATLKLLRHNPFPDRPPRYVRARLYRYRFTTRRERRQTGAWWARSPAGEVVGPVTLDPGRRTWP